MLIALPWEHEGPTDTFTRSSSKLRCGIPEGPTPCSLTVVPASTVQVSTRTGRGKCRAPPGAAYWLSGLNEAPHAQASVPASGAPRNLTIPAQNSPFWSWPGDRWGVLMGLQGSVCAIATVKGWSGSEVDTTATHPDWGQYFSNDPLTVPPNHFFGRWHFWDNKQKMMKSN